MHYNEYRNIVILTGAGISAESGLPTYRGNNGLLKQSQMEHLARPDTFRKDPAAVHDFYNKRRKDLKQAKPNKAHDHITYMQKELTGSVIKLTIITQNVDDLHEKSGTENVLHIHGELNKAICEYCGTRTACNSDLNTKSTCSSCGKTGRMRPDIVWFGEAPYLMDEVQDALSECDIFISIGTSNSVYPAAEFVKTAKKNGAHTIELNLEPSDKAPSFNQTCYGVASEIVPFWIDTFMHL